MKSESHDQILTANLLRRLGLRFCAVPNGGHRAMHEAKVLRAEGVSPGVPDLLIFDAPEAGGYVGAAIEMKRADGGKVSAEQREWIDALLARGWDARVCAGADAARDFITQLWPSRVANREPDR